MDFIAAGGVPILLPHNDKSGRPVIFHDARTIVFHSMGSMIRCNWYLSMVMLEEEIAQRKGPACVMYAPGQEFATNSPPISVMYQAMSRLNEVTRSLPIRTPVFHFCFDSPMTQFFLSVLRAGFGKKIRVRLTPHYGSTTEIIYSLRTFGIQLDDLIVPDTNNNEDVKSKMFQQFLENRRNIESKIQLEKADVSSNEKGMIACAQENDVLLGRGRRPHSDFPGNKRFAKIIEEESTRYKACSHQFEKARIVKDIIQSIHDAGGRFLKHTSGGWEEIGEEAAIKKVGDSLRAQVRGEGGGEVSSRKAKRPKV